MTIDTTNSLAGVNRILLFAVFGLMAIGAAIWLFTAHHETGKEKRNEDQRRAEVPHAESAAGTAAVPDAGKMPAVPNAGKMPAVPNAAGMHAVLCQ